MVVLHRPAAGPGVALADRVEAVLREASAAYRVATCDGPPFATDGDARIAGEGLLPWARAYAAEVRRWSAFAGDYCLVDDGGTIC